MASKPRPPTVDELHAGGAEVVCYVSAGSGERWLDIRKVGTLRPIMERRMDVCRREGFDAIEPANVDGYANKSGFPLTYKDQIAYNRMLAAEAHEHGLSITPKRYHPGRRLGRRIRLRRGRRML